MRRRRRRRRRARPAAFVSWFVLYLHQQLADGVTIVTIFNQAPSSRIMRLLTLHFIRQFDHEGWLVHYKRDINWDCKKTTGLLIGRKRFGMTSYTSPFVTGHNTGGPCTTPGTPQEQRPHHRTSRAIGGGHHPRTCRQLQKVRTESQVTLHMHPWCFTWRQTDWLQGGSPSLPGCNTGTCPTHIGHHAIYVCMYVCMSAVWPPTFTRW